MKAVAILRNIENYFERNHNFFCLWGGLLSAIFLCIFVPFNLIDRVSDRMNFQLEQYQRENSALTARVGTMNNELRFLRLSYEEKQRVMREVDCLAKNIYFEAGSEPRVGKIAVAEVTMNRVRSKQFPRSVCGVVYQKNKNICQFSWVCQDGKVIRSRKIWRESLQIAENILISGHNYGIVGTAKYFHADYVRPYWANQKVLAKQIGNHVFYH